MHGLAAPIRNILFLPWKNLSRIYVVSKSGQTSVVSFNSSVAWALQDLAWFGITSIAEFESEEVELSPRGARAKVEATDRYGCEMECPVGFATEVFD